MSNVRSYATPQTYKYTTQKCSQAIMREASKKASLLTKEVRIFRGQLQRNTKTPNLV